ncbi:hypothetical protein [Neobacillus kokaensis]|uniref:LSM domain-containing protein n=1 Tax=Neobacillus kokaensis TaxID=2759023 RepID=A0ABQ3N5W7_9BACI|nr:hypothetical protein [Neobacillus kokaensis]GHH99441.1 hypothetical protein AM1BK_29840 [Neobacillus kokaensis]
MNRKIILQQDENVLSTLTGLIESFDGMQNVYFGDLFLTNKRLFIVSNKLINVEVSLWFEGEEMGNIGHSTLIVGEHRITVRWTYKGNLLNFMKTFQQLNVSA